MATMRHLSVLLFLTLLSFTHARDVQMFNKIPSKVNENVVVKEEQPQPLNTQNQQQQQPEEQQPNFVPDNENGYGLYGHESGQLPPSTTTTTGNNQPLKDSNFPVNAKYLPKNYNTVAYVTQPEDFSDNSFEDNNNNNNNNNYNSYNNENNNFNNNNNNYYNAQEQVLEEAEYMDRRNNKNNFQGNSYNNNFQDNNYNFQQQQQGLGVTKFMDKAYTTTPNNNYNYNYDNNNNFNNMNYEENSINNAVRYNRVQPQGMSDTRFLENGKYYYDINAGRHSRDPTETAKEFAMRNQQYNPAGYRGNSNEYNNNLYYNNNYNDNNNNFMGAEDDLP